jgi:hypothetical protein
VVVDENSFEKNEEGLYEETCDGCCSATVLGCGVEVILGVDAGGAVIVCCWDGTGVVAVWVVNGRVPPKKPPENIHVCM